MIEPLARLIATACMLSAVGCAETTDGPDSGDDVAGDETAAPTGVGSGNDTDPSASGDANPSDSGGTAAGELPAPECPGVDIELPPPLNACLGGGNDENVGQTCSIGGGECTGTPAQFCSVDFEPEAEFNFCTKPCVVDAQCGEDAFCQVDPDDPEGPKGCLPIVCDPDGYEQQQQDTGSTG